MARKPTLNTFINNLVKNPSDLLWIGGAVFVGYMIMKNFSGKLPPVVQQQQPMNPVMTKTQMATDDGSTWTYGNVQNDDIAPGEGDDYARGVAHNQRIIKRGYEQYHSPNEALAEEMTDSGDPAIANAYSTATKQFDYNTAVIPSNSSGPIADFDTNNEVVEVVDYEP